jgi:aspartate aminotransferase
VSISSGSSAAIRLSDKSERVAESITLAITARAKAMKLAGQDVIAFTAGEPDLPVPAAIQAAGESAIRRGLGVYTNSAGISELRELAAARFRAMGLASDASNVVITPGAKSAIYLALFALLNEGDEVVFPSPYWGSYSDMTLAAGGVHSPFRTLAELDFQPTPEALRAALSPRTRVLLLNSPNNPTGTVYGPETLRGLATVLREFPQVVILSDDIYDTLIYTGETFSNLAMVAPDLEARTLTINSLSKSHSMTGWRIGYSTGPKLLTDAIARIQSQVSGSPPAISQYAALEAFRQPLDPGRARDLDERRLIMLDGLKQLRDLPCPEPRGAFYAFPSIDSWIGSRHGDTVIDSASTFSRLLLERHLVATVSGEAFGVRNHIRLTYTVPASAIREGIKRIGMFLSELTSK